MKSLLSHRISHFNKHHATLDEWADIIDAIGTLVDPDELIRLLPLNHEFFGLPILERLLAVHPNEAEILLAIALFHFNHGDDEQAETYFERARCLAPSRLDVIQAEIFIACGIAPDEVNELCLHALKLYPEDSWVKNAADLSGQNKLCSNIVLPSLRIYAEDS